MIKPDEPQPGGTKNMGIDFDYEFHVHRRDVRRFLTAAAKLCDPQESRWTTVLLPDGTSMRLPGTHRFISGTTVELAGLNLDLSLCFPQDEPLRVHRAEETDQTESAQVVIGYIYLSVSDTFAVLPEHWRFTFMTATSAQSRLFLSSPSVRETFATLALTTGATLCLLDNDLGGPKIVVTAQDHRVSTRVPGPCLLWNASGHDVEAFEELTSRLAGQPADQPKWIIGPEHPDHAAAVDSLADYARVAPHLWSGP
ncbi:hypothetical protein [Lentzea sp. NPDC055074]